MPTKFNTKVLADKTALEKAVKKILIMTRDINNYVLVETKDDSMATSSGDTDKGAANTSIPAVITGDEQTIGINGKYITEYIRNISSDEIEINIVDNQKPLVFKDTSDDQYTYIARPLLK
jgi:DNA polymerase III sliding clamp (beta) subunit (PCNA family)